MQGVEAELLGPRSQAGAWERVISNAKSMEVEQVPLVPKLQLGNAHFGSSASRTLYILSISASAEVLKRLCVELE